MHGSRQFWWKFVHIEFCIMSPACFASVYPPLTFQFTMTMNMCFYIFFKIKKTRLLTFIEFLTYVFRNTSCDCSVYRDTAGRLRNLSSLFVHDGHTSSYTQNSGQHWTPTINRTSQECRQYDAFCWRSDSCCVILEWCVITRTTKDQWLSFNDQLVNCWCLCNGGYT